jgi:hypothetical protein
MEATRERPRCLTSIESFSDPLARTPVRGSAEESKGWTSWDVMNMRGIDSSGPTIAWDVAWKGDADLCPVWSGEVD